MTKSSDTSWIDDLPEYVPPPKQGEQTAAVIIGKRRKKKLRAKVKQALDKKDKKE
jgi:hypothetical protein